MLYFMLLLLLVLVYFWAHGSAVLHSAPPEPLPPDIAKLLRERGFADESLPQA